MDDDDFFVEDVIANHKNRKKKVNSGDKGKRGERQLCELLNKRFPGKDAFFRTVGSGNRWSQVQLSGAAQDVLTADVVCPEGFKFSIECKYGYADIELSSIFDDGNKRIDEFLEKAARDANRVKKAPLLCWRKPRYPWLAFVRNAPIGDFIETGLVGSYFIKYRDWYAVSLTKLLSLDDSVFFTEVAPIP